MKRFSMLFLVLLLGVACSPKLDALYKVPEIKKDKAANIIIIRDRMALYTFYPAVNKKKVGGLSNREYVKFQLPEGRYAFRNMIPFEGHTSTFSAILFGGGSYAHWGWDELKIHVENGEDYYFLLSISFGVQPEIELLSRDKGLELMAKSTLVPTGTISGKSDKDVELLVFDVSEIPINE